VDIAEVCAILDLSLEQALAQVKANFDVEAILARRISPSDVVDYYDQCDGGYRRFHSAEGALHLALNTAGGATTSSFAEQGEFFLRHFDACDGRHAIEFGSGAGYNLRWLAKRRPECTFLGVDLCEDHVRDAIRDSEGLENLQFAVANYEHLMYGDASVCGVLAVETLCQTADVHQALHEARRLLRPGGRLVVIDCFRLQPLEIFAPELQQAAQLVEKTTAVNAFSLLDEFRGAISADGFQELECVDLSAATRSDLARLYKLARMYFKSPSIVRSAGRALKPKLIENAIAGLLMPFTVGYRAHGYYALAFERM